MENSKNSWVCLGCASFQLTQCIILVIRCSRCSWVSRTVMVQCIIWPIPCSLSLLNILSHCITESASLHPYCLLSYSVLGVYILSRISSWKFDQEQFPTILLMQTQNTVCRWRFGVGSTAKRGYRLLTKWGPLLRRCSATFLYKCYLIGSLLWRVLYVIDSLNQYLPHSPLLLFFC